MNAGKKPHKHAEVIKAWADGEEIQFQMDSNGSWEDCKNNRPTWYEYNEYRVKPREFPKSSLSNDELTRLRDGYGASCARAIADAAIKQYILDLEREAANGF